MMAGLVPQLSIYAFILAREEPESWDFTFDLVRTADRAGIDRAVLTGEHVVFGENLAAYGDPASGGRSGGVQMTDTDGHYLDPLIAAAMMFAQTTHVRLTTNVILAPLRRPIVLAKTAATLDVLSRGRLDLGVGIGWQREEYEAAGLAFEKRGRLLDHSLEVCRELWRERRASYSSPELSFENIHMMPKPLTPGGVPIWVSGNLKAPVVRRLAKFGSGWLPWGIAMHDMQLLHGEIAVMRELVAKEGRDPSNIQVAGDLPLVLDGGGRLQIDATMEQVPPLVAAGITDFRARIALPQGSGEAEAFLAALAAAFRDVTGRPPFDGAGKP
jgi:probable F420-dependent oxidoreductase